MSNGAPAQIISGKLLRSIRRPAPTKPRKPSVRKSRIQKVSRGSRDGGSGGPRPGVWYRVSLGSMILHPATAAPPALRALMNNRGVTGYMGGGQVKAPTPTRSRAWFPSGTSTSGLMLQTHTSPNLGFYIYQQNN